MTQHVEGRTTTPRPGRPRLTEAKRRGETARDEILDAAAELFTGRGFTNTSTRLIAEAVGIRQASMYHYFRTKDDILAALLDGTVSHSVSRARELLDANGPAIDRLLELARFDATALAGSRWNLGALYLLPELRDHRFLEFRSAREELARAYETLSSEAMADPEDPRRLLPFRLVESIVNVRSDRYGMLYGLAEDSADDLVDPIVGAVAGLIGQVQAVDHPG